MRRGFGGILLKLGMVIIVSLTLLIPPSIVQAQENPPDVIEITFFRRDGCPHCAEEEEFLEVLMAAYPSIQLNSYEVTSSPENRELFQQKAAELGFEARFVPVTIIGDAYWIGFDDDIREEIQATVEACSAGSCSSGSEVEDDWITLPIVGRINLASQSLFVSTLLISFVDGFNPCSLWVLSMLMALVIHTGSRRKVLLIGLIFLSVTAAVYGIFIAGLFSVLSVLSFVGWVQALVAVVALVFGLINIKDYFWYKEGISLSISDKKKPGIFQNMRRVVNSSESILGLAGATVILAGGVSLVEFSCTAGLPVVWTNLLAAHRVDALNFALLLLLYLVIYQIDELVIFLTVVFTLKASRLEEKEGRILKLIGGIIMLTLATVILIDPAAMSSVSGSLLVFAIAFGAVILVLLVHRLILPKFGIVIGSEKFAANGKRQGK